MSENKTKYIFVTGGVLSSLGKGITAASVGTLLKHTGQRVGVLKLDPYINVDPGTLNPYEHGECYVTHDGAETEATAALHHLGDSVDVYDLIDKLVFFCVLFEQRVASFLWA